MSDDDDKEHEPLTEAQKVTAREVPWYRRWLLEHGYSKEEL
jgi:hypothetical protein